MAMGKYSRVDGRRSSSNCLATTVVVVVGVCLVGAWMLMSSSVDFSITGQFGDKSGKSVEDSYKGDANVDSVQETEKMSTKEFDNTNVKSYGDKTEKPESDDDGKSESEQEKEQVEVAKKGEDEEDSKSNDSDTESTATEEKKNAEEEKAAGEQRETEESSSEGKQETNEGEAGSGSEESQGEAKQGGEDEETREKTVVVENVGETKSVDSGDEQNGISEEKTEEDKSETNGKDQSELVKESTIQNGAFSTQSSKSESEKESQAKNYKWKTCNATAGPDYIPCLDNHQAIRKLTSRSHYEHRERHCPEDPPTCLVPLPEGYRSPVKWPRSRDKIWFHNVPHTKLAEYKGHQNWVKVSGEYLTFPGGGTQFIHGALHYIDFIQQTLSDIAWGKRTRVILDVGCGVASFGGFLFERDVIAMSLAPKDEHEAQVQFALERGIPAFSAVMGTKRLPFPSMVFDIVHCARCRVPWHAEGGKLLLELNRVLRPGGYFVWSATPVYQKIPEDVAIWKEMSKLTKSMCWELVKIGKDKLNGVGAAVYRKPTSNDCYMDRAQSVPPLCEESDDPNAAWNVPLQACMHKVPVDASVRGSQWPPTWPSRLKKAPYWLKSSDVGVYGKSAPKDFTEDYEHWKHVVANSYMKGMGIDWTSVRNVMDMRALYGGFAAALKDLKVWVMNVVPIDSPDTLPIIYERGLFGMYHDWCESFSTYPRTYDLLHADHILSSLKKRCNIVAVIAEVDRILRPGGYLILRDKAEIISEVENMAKSLHWKVQMLYSEGKEGMLCVQKTKWRPAEVETLKYAIA